MAKQTKPTNQRSARNAGSTANHTRGTRPAAPKRQPQPAKKRRETVEPTPGETIWKFALILCTGLIIVALLFASINGGSKYVGLTEKDTNATPTPPVATIDPNLNITGSDQTPIPPSASPEAGDTVEGETQTVTP